MGQSNCGTGIKPKKWQTLFLGDCATLVRQTVLPSEAGDIPYIGLEHIRKGGMRLLGHGKASNVTSMKTPFQAGDILFGKLRPYFCKVVLTAFEGICSTDIWVLRPKQGVDRKFLFYLLVSRSFIDFATSSSGGTRMPRAKWDYVSKYKIQLPPLLEQRKIAKILSAWDQAIETIEKLIVLERVLQNGFIQKFLSNKRWPERSLGEIGDISSAGVDKKTKAGEKPVRLLNYLDVLNRDYISDSDLNHWVTATDRQIESCDIRKGDVFFTPSSEIRNDIAHSAVAAENIKGAVYSYHVVRLRIHEPWDINFRAYAFKSPRFYKRAYQLCEGSGQRYVLSQKIFRHMTVRVPPLKTQRIIGAMLRSIDEEISAFKIIATALRKEKKALMQQLLTGKRRVETENSK